MYQREIIKLSGNINRYLLTEMVRKGSDYEETEE